jgi:hypothetical protein
LELKKQKICFTIISIILIIFSSTVVIANNESAENERGICDAWFSKDAENWENATAKTSLKLGQHFYIKVMIKAKTNLSFIRYQMSCYGPSYDFELVDIICDLPDNSQILKHSSGREIQDVAFSNVNAGEEYTHIWKLRVKANSTFGGGITPINLDSFFFDGNNEKQMLFTIVSVSIIDELWEDYTAGDKNNNSINFKSNNSSKNTLGFDIILMISTIFLILFIKKKKYLF